jgi:arylsulfatase A
VRVGDWKGVRQNLARRGKNGKAKLKIELYNLASDIGETNDVAAEHPEIVAKIEEIMRREHTPSEVFPLPSVDR